MDPKKAPVIPQPHTHLPLSRKQILQRNRGYGMFIHFGPNTFNEIEWSDGTLPMESYLPTQLDCDQWVRVAKEAGMRYVILITKHHDGFCLWPTEMTDHCVTNSPVPTDVVGEVAKACRKHGLDLGLYYSLWDRREPSHGDPDPRKYQDFMFAQLEELMSGYGPICELWLDGAWGKKNDTDWNIPELYQRVTRLQPDCIVCVNHTVEIPGKPRQLRRPADMVEGDPLRFWPVDLRLLDPNLARADDPQIYSWQGEMKRLPFEHTVCISDGWNWFQKKGGTPTRSVDELELLYYWCTRGDNSLIINLPPDETGRIRDEEAASMVALAQRLGIRGGGPLPSEAPNALFSAPASASSSHPEHPASMAVDTSLERSWWATEKEATLEVIPGQPVQVDRITLVEAPVDTKQPDGFTTLHQWQVEAFELDLCVGGSWRTVHQGKGMGAACFIDFPKPEIVEGFRLRVTRASAPPRVAHVGACLKSQGGLRPLYEV